MKNFFLLSDTGRMKRGLYLLNILLIRLLESIIDVTDSMPYWLAIVLSLIGIGWAIYVISARIHDLGYPGWLARIQWLFICLYGVMHLEGFLESINIFVLVLLILLALLGGCCSCVLLFCKGQERDNEYGPNPYLTKRENAHKKETIENNENDIAIKKQNLKATEKTTKKNKSKADRVKKDK